MTERKSTEIKIRVTPSFKARVQGAADAAGVSLTEWLESASEEKMAARSVSGGNSFPGVYLSPATHPCKDCGQQLPPHTSHCGTCVQGFPPRWTEGTHPAKSWMYQERATSG